MTATLIRHEPTTYERTGLRQLIMGIYEGVKHPPDVARRLVFARWLYEQGRLIH